MSFAAERQAFLQGIVDTRYPSTSPTSDFTTCRTLEQLQEALIKRTGGENAQDDANAAVQLVGLALRDLLRQGLLLQSEIDYWAQIEDHKTDQSAYLLQSKRSVLL